jgi:16S rRNA (cytidine1402-2'-O)-methyltransferase
VPIPGASSVLCALVASGMAGDGRFRFVGFLPRDGKKRREALETVTETPEVSILFEAPSRLQATLVDLAGVTPNRKVCIARELTKVHEELVHGTCADLAAQERTWLGEVVLVLGHHVPADRAAAVSDEEIDAVIDQALAKGEASRIVAERLATWSGRSRRDMYERILARKR